MVDHLPMLFVGPRHLALLAAFASLPFVAPTAARADRLLTRAGTGTAGASQSVDRAQLRIIPGR